MLKIHIEYDEVDETTHGTRQKCKCNRMNLVKIPMELDKKCPCNRMNLVKIGSGLHELWGKYSWDRVN